MPKYQEPGELAGILKVMNHFIINYKEMECLRTNAQYVKINLKLPAGVTITALNAGKAITKNIMP